MQGVVAAGYALSGATVRVLDATGKAIATGKPVVASTGAYGPIALSGGGPYRVEACGLLAGRQRCLWGATGLGGTLHLTPLSSAQALLASGLGPDALMSGPVAGLGDAALATAHAQLLAALAPALADAGLAADVNLLGAELKPGTHTGLDRLLDSVVVGFGQDGGKPFVQLSPRMGAGLAYLEPGSTQGSFSLDPGAAALDLAGLDALFAAMATATASNNSCQGGLVPLFDASARYNIDDLVFNGADQSAQLLCFRLAGVLGDGELLFGGKLLPPDLGRCEQPAGGDLSCRLTLNWQTAKGELRVLGVEQAAVKRSAGWRYLGNRLEVQASATARSTLARRIDASAPDALARFIDVAVPAAAGLQCAKVSQKDAAGLDLTLAYFKRHSSGKFLSLWSLNSGDATPSLNPASGATRAADVVAVPLPIGADGDAAVRNFVRVGRALRIDLYTDAACSAPWAGSDGASLRIELQGLPPLASTALAGLAWPAAVPAAGSALAGLKGAANSKFTLVSSWTFPKGGLTLHAAQLCLDAACTSSKLAETSLTGNATAVTFTGTLPSNTVDPTSFKQVRLLGRTADGMLLQTDLQACPSFGAGLACK